MVPIDPIHNARLRPRGDRGGEARGEGPGAARVVLVSPRWLGDAVMSLPLVGYLAAAPGACLTVAARGAAGRVYWGVDGVADLVVLDEGARLGRIAALSAVTGKKQADGVVVLPPSFSSALGCFLGGARRRVGFRSDARRFLLSASLDAAPLRSEHLSQSYLRLGRLLLEELGKPGGHAVAAPRVRTFEEERRTVRARLEEAGAGRGGYAVVVPGATYGPTKSWPAGKYRELVRRLAKDTFVVLGGARPERGLCAEVGGGAPGTANFAGETTLGEFMALLEGARVVVANDSGAPHVAASLGAPVVVIFGSTSPAWTAPLGEEVVVIREPVHCSPCFLRRCPTRLECYEGIGVERVLEAARSAVKKRFEKEGSG